MTYQKIKTAYWSRGFVMNNGKFEMTIGYNGSIDIQNWITHKYELRISNLGSYLFSLFYA